MLLGLITIGLAVMLVVFWPSLWTASCAVSLVIGRILVWIGDNTEDIEIAESVIGFGLFFIFLSPVVATLAYFLLPLLLD